MSDMGVFRKVGLRSCTLSVDPSDRTTQPRKQHNINQSDVPALLLLQYRGLALAPRPDNDAPPLHPQIVNIHKPPPLYTMIRCWGDIFLSVEARSIGSQPVYNLQFPIYFTVDSPFLLLESGLFKRRRFKAWHYPKTLPPIHRSETCSGFRVKGLRTQTLSRESQDHICLPAPRTGGRKASAT